MAIKVFEYKNCSTCQKALKFLESKKLRFERIPIVDTPPSLTELKKMLVYLKAGEGSIKNLFNTSGEKYRELKIADKLKAGMTEQESLQLLSENGKLIKRPFVLTATAGVVGFKEEQWEKLFSK